MSGRSEQIETFLKDAKWGGARRAKLAGDASFRSYDRVTLEGRQAVLMDAPPEKEDVWPFLRAAEHLLACGLSAPKVLAADAANGLLLLEDLGDDLYSRVLMQDASKEEALYLAAAELLADLHAPKNEKRLAAFAPYDEALLMREVALFSEWFMPAVMGGQAVRHAEQYLALWRRTLGKLPGLRSVFVLRDYHADNLLWLPDRTGMARVGLLDFQDAVIGSPAYDMVSFLEDARRDVSPQTVKRAIALYLEKTGIAREDFEAAYALLGAQRNCKIVGIFVRLARRDGKRNYLSYLPRVWAHLENDLRHPLLAPLAKWMDETIRPEWRGVITLGKATA